ncbi:MAG: GNAT family N-acetyltransferase [Burkholderiaceae bacterium]
MPAALLRSPRLTLRQWEERDLAPFAALNADPAVMEFFVAPLSKEESAAMIERASATLASRGWGWWCLDIEGECAGFIGLTVPGYDTPFMPCVEIGWRLARRYWGHGYATEGARRALAYGFDVIGLDEIVSFTTTSNLRSRRVMERIGMTRDLAGDFDHPRVPEGHALQRHVLYRLRGADYLGYLGGVDPALGGASAAEG